MHIIHYYQRGKNRTSAEKRIRRMNAVVVALQVALFAYCLIQLLTTKKDSVYVLDGERVVGGQGLRDTVANNCSNTDAKLNLKLTPLNYDLVLDPNVLRLLMFRSISAIQLAVIIIGVYLGVGVISKAMFEFNIRKVQVRSLYFWKSSLTVVEWSLLIASYVFVADAYYAPRAIGTFLDNCVDNGASLVSFSLPMEIPYALLALSTLWEVILTGVSLRNGFKECRLDDPDLVYDEYGDVVCRKDGDPLSAEDVANNCFRKPRISTEEFRGASSIRQDPVAVVRHGDPSGPLPQRRAPPFQDKRRNDDFDEHYGARTRAPLGASNARFAHVGAIPGRRYN